jgi:hypothetical protein
MRVLRSLLVAALLATPLALAASASPSGAQVPTEITGEADCNEDGTYTLSYEIESFVGVELDIDSAELSGAATGSVTFSPNPIPVGGTSSGSIDVPGDTDGTVTLTVDYSGPKFDFDESFDLDLAGDCEAIVTTTTTTLATTTTAAPPAPVAAAVAARPAFTG